MQEEIKKLKDRIFRGVAEKEEPLETSDEFSALPEQQEFIGQFTLEEVLEALSKRKSDSIVLVNEPEASKNKTLEELSSQAFLLQNNGLKLPEIMLYNLGGHTYYLYLKKKKEEETKKKEYNDLKELAGSPEKSYGLFMPTGLVVRRVPQNILGNGVLGRAFIHLNYIEILDFLIGDEYMEVLTHEVLHIMYPNKKEVEIRMMTKYQVGEKSIYH